MTDICRCAGQSNVFLTETILHRGIRGGIITIIAINEYSYIFLYVVCKSLFINIIRATAMTIIVLGGGAVGVFRDALKRKKPTEMTETEKNIRKKS